MMTVEPYVNETKNEWNAFVAKGKNSTFLHDRNFMDYHSARFHDVSIVFRDEQRNICGVLPANFNEEDAVIVSHGGLTYGGLIIGQHAVQTSVNEMFRLAITYYSEHFDAHAFCYKPTPYIYHCIPAQEDLYALFHAGAILSARTVSSALKPLSRIPYRKGRKACVTKAKRLGLRIMLIKDPLSPLLEQFYELLSSSLLERHNVKPVHSYAEMRLLMQRFPNNIRLYIALSEAEIQAGAWVFVTHTVAHTQYLANSKEGRKSGAEDLLIDYLITHEFTDKPFFDFGISTENNGTILNENLISMKEGFGARSVCYDTYTMALPQHS